MKRNLFVVSFGVQADDLGPVLYQWPCDLPTHWDYYCLFVFFCLYLSRKISKKVIKMSFHELGLWTEVGPQQSHQK
jgi:hypothetical protein